MKNIFDYLTYYGDTSMDEFPYNEMDGLLFSLLSYVKLNDIVPKGIKDFIYLEDACYKFLDVYSEKDFKKEDWLFPNSYRLMERLKTAKRFFHTKLYHLTCSIDEKGQFGAITIRLPNKITYISMEGTDSSVVGWKEDFEMMYEFPIYSQKKAREYFDETLTLFDRNIYVGGHSKGGNLAMYAYMFGKKTYKKRVRQVYNFDGPGFLSDVMNSSLYQEMIPKLTMIVPRESVVGMILGHGDYKVVNSSARAMLQHDAYTWECFGGCLVEGELSRKSQNLEKNLRDYLDGMTEEEKRSFVETFFAIFKKTNITNIMQLKDLKISLLLSLMREVTNIPSTTKRNLVAILRMLITGMN